MKTIITFLWKVYHLFNIKDSRFIYREISQKINGLMKLRKTEIGTIQKESGLRHIYRSGLPAIEDNATILAHALLTGTVDYTVMSRIVCNGVGTLNKIEKMFRFLSENEMQVGYDRVVSKKTELFEDIIYLYGYSDDHKKIVESTKNTYHRIAILEGIYSFLVDEKYTINSLDKNIIVGEYDVFHDMKLDTILKWADDNKLSIHGNPNCRKINSLVISRPPEVTDDEELKIILDLYSKIAMVLRDILYVIDTTDIIIKMIAAKFHNDEIRWITPKIKAK